MLQIDVLDIGENEVVLAVGGVEEIILLYFSMFFSYFVI